MENNMLRNNKEKLFLIKTVFIIMLLIIIIGFYEISVADIFVTASLKEQVNQDYHLRIKMQNQSNKKVVFAQGLMPWSETIWNRLILIAVEIEPNQRLIPRANYLRNPVGKIEIEPRQEILGDISLTRAFPSLKEVLRRSDVLIFWSHQLPKQNGVVFKRSGGWVYIEKLEGKETR
jgi:hypothetical protein